VSNSIRKTLKANAERLLERFGYGLVPSWMLPDLPLANHLRELFHILNIDCVLDVGANTGQYRDFLRGTVGYNGMIVSFEPVKKNLEILDKRAQQDSNWLICDFALGAEENKTPINVMDTNSFSSFLKPTDSVLNDFSTQNNINHQEIVEIKRLDGVLSDLIRDHPISNIYLKMDTQGYDLEVFKGAQRLLPSIKALQTELSVQQIYEGMPDYITAIQTLNKHGFDITGMYPVSRDRILRVVEFDCIMINTNQASR
jgi:FkbM family methyltransferase